MNIFASKKVLGLDIGTSSIKIAELDVSRSGASLISFSSIPTPRGLLSGGEISNPNSVGLLVKELIRQIKSKRKYVATGMWGTSVIVKKITIPRVEKKLIEDQIKWEAEQYIPFDINDISLGYHVINPNAKTESMDILIIAALKEMVSKYTASIYAAGLEVAAIDVNGFALANVFEANYGKFGQTSIALLNVGASISNFVVVHDGEVIFCRDIPVGGASYTNEISKEMGITYEEAEALKISAVEKKEVPDQVYNIIASTNEAITEEIRNSFDFFAASNNGFVISRCFFTGGASLTPGLLKSISQVTAIEAEPLNPFLKIKSKAKNLNASMIQHVAPISAISLGLALRKAGDA